MRDPNFFRADLCDRRDQLRPIDVIRNDKRQLDAVLAVAMTVATSVLLIAANRICALGAPVALMVFGVSFVGGWALQLLGHGYEGRRPALVDNLFQVVIAPIFLMAELFFALGYKRDVAERVEQLALRAERPT